MNRISLSLLLLTALGGVVGCASQEKAERGVARTSTMMKTSSSAAAAHSRAYLGARNLPASGIALEGYCPVAYFTANEPIEGRPEHASDHEGVTYLFSSAEAKRLFDSEPAKYVPAYGGWCAYGMAVSDKFPVDPTSFEIVDGRLLLFLKNASVDARDLWRRGEARELRARADAHWRKVRG